MRRLVLLFISLTMVGILTTCSARSTVASRQTRTDSLPPELNVDFTGLLVFDPTDTGATVRFPDGSDYHVHNVDHSHYPFVRFRRADLVGAPPPGYTACDNKLDSVQFDKSRALSLEGLIPEPVEYTGDYLNGGILFKGLTTIADVCQGGDIDSSLKHATLKLTAGELDVKTRTKGQWQFIPGPKGEAKGGRWKLANRVALKAHLSGTRVVVKGLDTDLVLDAKGGPLWMEFRNAMKPCPKLVSLESLKRTAKEGPDEHFRIYYRLIKHDNEHGQHVPHGDLDQSTNTIPSEDDSGSKNVEEGGGCPPLRRTPPPLQ